MLTRIIYLMLLCFLLGCGGGVTLRYHAERKDLIPAKSFDSKVLCEKINKDFSLDCEKDENIKKDIESFIEYVTKQLPDYYFSKDGHDSSHFKPKCKPHVDITALKVKEGEKKEEPPFFTSISPMGQKSIIELLAMRSGTKDDIDIKVLEKLLSALQNQKKEESEKTFNPYEKIRLMFSTSANSSKPADRIEKVNIFLFISEGAKIADVEKLEPEWAKINLAKQTAEETFALSLGSAGTKMGAEKSVSEKSDEKSYKVGIEVPFGLSEITKKTLERNINKEFALKSISVNSKKDTLIVREEGIEGIDISGNLLTNITLQLAYTPAVLSIFQIKEQNSEFKVNIEEEPLIDAGDVKALSAWVAQVREVPVRDDILGNDGSKTIEESDDKVTPHINIGFDTVTLWSNREILYFIAMNYKKNDCNKAFLVYKRKDADKPRLVAFKNLEDALKFKKILLDEIEIKKKEDRKVLRDYDVGFTVDQNGKIDENAVNIIWADGDNASVDLTKMSIYITDPDDFPLSETFSKKYIWENRKCTLPQKGSSN